MESIEKENLNGTINTLSKQKTVYNLFSGNNARGLTNNILPKEIWVALTGGTLEKRVEYVAYDTFGNPLEYKQDEVSTSMIWGYNNSLLIGLVKNATAGQVSSALSSTGLNTSNFSVTNLSNTQITTLANFRAALPNTQVSWFTHIPQVGISNTFAPNGLGNFYEYDSFQRLTTSKDHEGNLTAFNLYKITPTNNYIRTSFLRVATTNTMDALSFLTAKIGYQLFDGFGRPTQTLGYGQTPDLKTLLGTEISYDRWGRTIQNLLPVSSGALTFSPISNGKNLAQSFYNDTAPTDSTIYEASPLNRTKASFGAGGAWRGSAGSPTSQKKTQLFYESAGSDVRYYTVNSSNSVILSGFYPAKSLFKKRIIDEQGSTSIEITDKRGRLVQKQTQKDNSGNWLTTYYCYDGMGRTRAILQPMAYNLNQSINATDQAHRDFVFAFEYDSRGRLIREDIPGAEERYSVYDKRDRLVMQKDALQNESGKWNFWKYDAFDREVMRGETGNIGFNQSYWASLFAGHTPINETWGSGGYNAQSFPSAVSAGFNEVQLYTFYDQYDFVSALNTNFAFDAGNAYHTQYSNATGLLTGRVKYNQDDHNQYFMEAQYYDSKNRPIQSFETHALSPTLPNRKDFEYTFAGEVLKERAVLRNINEATKTRTKEYTYDHVGRKTSFKLGINGSTEKILQYSYDPIGRQITKHYYPDRTYRQADSTFDYILRPPNPDSNTTDLARRAVNLLPGTSIIADSTNFYLAHIDTLNTPITAIIAGMQKMDFGYHIRGLMNCTNCQGNVPNPNLLENDLFANKLEWETAGRYDANIGKQTWKNRKDNKTRTYIYQYDPSSRMTAANYTGSGNENYSLSHLSFDDNGNILKLKRKGFTGTSFSNIDNLTYTYNGNRSKAITDSVLANLNTKDFRDSLATTDYTYYANGNLKSDLNKGISNIEYNTYLNKQKKITLFNGKELILNYDGAGMLISRIITDSTKWQYTPDEIYKDDSLYQISQDEGRITRKNGKYKFEFEYRDIWGNLRTSFADSDSPPVSGVYSAPIVLQISDYDPLGFQHFNNQEGKNNFLFQKQERIFDLDLGYDFWKFRYSDASTGRFWMVDPLGSQYPHNSLFALQENKLGKGIELEGLEWTKFENSGITEINLKTNVTNQSSLNAKSTERLTSRLEKEFNKTFSQAEGTSSTMTISTDNSSTYNIVLKDQIEAPVEIKDNSGNIVGKSYVNGRTEKLGDTQSNTITVSVKDADGNNRSQSSIISTINHELGHSGGLSHPWAERKANDITNQKNNLMNSDANPDINSRGTGGKEITKGQMNIIKQRIK